MRARRYMLNGLFLTFLEDIIPKKTMAIKSELIKLTKDNTSHMTWRVSSEGAVMDLSKEVDASLSQLVMLGVQVKYVLVNYDFLRYFALFRCLDRKGSFRRIKLFRTFVSLDQLSNRRKSAGSLGKGTDEVQL